uniref:Uncharacterized protein n=1 Tax=Arundo donax TaxID=35708 RepID=A0A0A9I2Y9_ARUDO
MAHMHAVSLAAASLSGPQQVAGGVVVELRYPPHGTSFAAHDGTAPAPPPSAVPCAAEEAGAATRATAMATARRLCIVEWEWE